MPSVGLPSSSPSKIPVVQTTHVAGASVLTCVTHGLAIEAWCMKRGSSAVHCFFLRHKQGSLLTRFSHQKWAKLRRYQWSKEKNFFTSVDLMCQVSQPYGKVERTAALDTIYHGERDVAPTPQVARIGKSSSSLRYAIRGFIFGSTGTDIAA